MDMASLVKKVVFNMKLDNISCDIDGTVLDFTHKFTNWMFRRGTPILNSRVLEHGDDYCRYEKEDFEECYDLPFYPDAKEVLDELGAKHHMTFLTRRSIGCFPEIKNRVEDLTIKWQQKNFPYFSGVFFARAKEQYFKDKMFDLMLEDDANNAINISKYAPVLMLSRAWNQGLKIHENVGVVSDWKEIHFVIENFDKFYDEKKRAFIK